MYIRFFSPFPQDAISAWLRGLRFPACLVNKRVCNYMKEVSAQAQIPAMFELAFVCLFYFVCFLGAGILANFSLVRGAEI